MGSPCHVAPTAPQRIANDRQPHARASRGFATATRTRATRHRTQSHAPRAHEQPPPLVMLGGILRCDAAPSAPPLSAAVHAHPCARHGVGCAEGVYTHRPVCVRRPSTATSARCSWRLPRDESRRPDAPALPRAAWGTAAASLDGDRVEVFGHFRHPATRAPARARRGVRPQPPPPGLEAPAALLARRASRRRAAAASAKRPLRARVFHPSAGDHELVRGRRRPPAGRSASRATTRRRKRTTRPSRRGGAGGRPRAAARAAPAAARAARERALPSAERAPVLAPPWRRQRPPRPRPAALQA